MSVFGVFLVQYGELQYLTVLSPNAGKYGPEILQIWTHFTQWNQLISDQSSFPVPPENSKIFSGEIERHHWSEIS